MATESGRLRVVLDTNSVVAGIRSLNPSSPNAELLRRWEGGEFDLLYSDDLRAEYTEKLASRGADPGECRQFLETLARRGVFVRVQASDVVPVIASDPDDDVVLACALKGAATHIVTYDPHFDSLRGDYSGIRILRPLDFLYLVRGDVPPGH